MCRAFTHSTSSAYSSWLFSFVKRGIGLTETTLYSLIFCAFYSVSGDVFATSSLIQPPFAPFVQPKPPLAGSLPTATLAHGHLSPERGSVSRSSVKLLSRVIRLAEPFLFVQPLRVTDRK